MKTHCLLLLLLLAVTAQARADEFEDLKASVQGRSSRIQDLKQQPDGVFREGKMGLLECTSEEIDPEQRKLLDSENAARTRLFQLIAQRADGAHSPEEVARTFAKMAALPVPPTPPPFQCIINPITKLPLKMLTRPFASVYSKPDEHAQKVRENAPAFTAYFVYQKTEGWYEVGSDCRGKKVGWMRADDVVQWKHDLVVQFTHPEGRLPVLMFDDKSALSQLVATPKNTRAPQVYNFHRVIAGAKLPANFPVRAREPRRSVPHLSKESQDQFYLLPIIDFEQAEIDGRESRLLQLAASTRKRGEIPLNVDPPPDPKGDIAGGVKVDVVFVMDLTRSMGLFADRTLEMITECTQRFSADPKVLEAIRFGIWGYRDFPELCHGIEFNTRNYTPELQELPDFARTLKAVQETKIDSIDYEEDVFAGVADAIEHTSWRPEAIRMINLVGDAPGRCPGETDPGCHAPNRPVGTKSGMNAESIRHLADEWHVYISALYLKTPKWAGYAQAGERQFRTLSRNPNVQPGRENFRFIDGRDTALYRATAQGLTDGIVECVRAAQSHRTPPHEQDGSPAKGDVETSGDADTTGRDLANKMFRGAMVEWLAKKDGTEAPRDVTAWACDKDLIDPAIQALDVQLFLTKNQLNSLKLMVKQILEAGLLGKKTGKDFFEALRAVVAATATTPDQIGKAETLAKTGVVPGVLNGLPYHSTLMEMSNETWHNMSPDDQDQFLQGVESKLRFYQEIHDNSEKWQPLNEGDDRDDWVANVPLEELP